MINSCIYIGTVIHKRFKPKEHFFKYKVFSLFIDLSELQTLSDKISFFSLNRFNLISFQTRSYLCPKKLKFPGVVYVPPSYLMVLRPPPENLSVFLGRGKWGDNSRQHQNCALWFQNLFFSGKLIIVLMRLQPKI